MYLCSDPKESYMSLDIKKTGIRALSGLLYVIIIICGLTTGVVGLTLLAALLAVISMIEFDKISIGLNRHTVPFVLIDVAACLSLAMSSYGYNFVLWIICLIVRFVMELYVPEREGCALRDLAYSLMGQLYIGTPMALMLLTGNNLGMPEYVLALFILIWINDTGAFLVGSLFGRNKLFPRISPKKTWEGFAGGCIFTVIAAIVLTKCFGSYFDFPVSLPCWIGLAIIAVCFATWGDLVESLIKRNLKIKDSGNIIPGHGGILDRLDSFLLVMPAGFLYIFWLIIR